MYITARTPIGQHELLATRFARGEPKAIERPDNEADDGYETSD